MSCFAKLLFFSVFRLRRFFKIFLLMTIGRIRLKMKIYLRFFWRYFMFSDLRVNLLQCTFIYSLYFSRDRKKREYFTEWLVFKMWRCFRKLNKYVKNIKVWLLELLCELKLNDCCTTETEFMPYNPFKLMMVKAVARWMWYVFGVAMKF